MEFTVAISGASGSIYAHRTLLPMIASGAIERVNLIRHLGIPHAGITRWKGLTETPSFGRDSK